MDSFADLYESAINAVVQRGYSKADIARKMGVGPPAIAGFRKDARKMKHDHLVLLADLARLTPAQTLEFEYAWIRSRFSTRGTLAGSFQAIWDAIGWLPSAKRKQAIKNIVSAYVSAIKNEK